MPDVKIRPVEFISNIEDMRFAQGHAEGSGLTPGARLLALRTARIADGVLRRSYYERRRAEQPTGGIPVGVATAGAILYYGLGWVHAEVTRPPFDAGDHRSVSFLRGVLAQGVTMCAELGRIINYWPDARVPEVLWAQYREAKRLEADLGSAIAAIEGDAQAGYQ